MKQIVIDGNNFSDEEGFYDEINRLLTRDLTWKTGHNPAAFNDLLRGGFGFHEYGEELEIKWINADKSRKDLGYDETVRFWEQRLATCHPSNRETVQKRIEDAKNHSGETLFDLFVSIILDNEDHNCKLEIIG